MQGMGIKFGVCAGAVLAGSFGAGAAAAAPLLAVDVDDRETVRAGTEANNTATGFSSFTLSSTPVTGTAPAVSNTTQTVDGYSVTVTAVNAAGAATGGIDDRDRALPDTAPTLNQLYDDFLFTASGVGVGGGIDLSIVSNGALAPNTQYNFSVYAYDRDSSGAPQPRTAAYFDGNNGDARVLTTSFAAATVPTTDDQYKFTGVVVTDASGNLLVRARNTTPTSTNASGGTVINPGVIVNGFEVNVIPEPGSLALLAAGGLLALRRRRA